MDAVFPMLFRPSSRAKSYFLFLLVVMTCEVHADEMEKRCEQALKTLTLKKCLTTKHSCKDRCGEFAHAMSVGVPCKRCACDAKCEVYNDCCWDFSEKCPQHYAAGLAQYEHLLSDADVTECKHGHFLYIARCPSRSTDATSTTSTQFISASTNAVGKTTTMTTEVQKMVARPRGDRSSSGSFNKTAPAKDHRKGSLLETINTTTDSPTASITTDENGMWKDISGTIFLSTTNLLSFLSYISHAIFFLPPIPVVDRTYGMLFVDQSIYRCYSKENSEPVNVPLVLPQMKDKEQIRTSFKIYLANDEEILQYFRACDSESSESNKLSDTCKMSFQKLQQCEKHFKSANTINESRFNVDEISTEPKKQSCLSLKSMVDLDLYDFTPFSANAMIPILTVWKVADTVDRYMIRSNTEDWEWMLCFPRTTECTILYCATFSQMSASGNNCLSPERMMSFVQQGDDLGITRSTKTITETSLKQTLESTPECVCFLIFRQILQLKIFETSFNNLCNISLHLYTRDGTSHSDYIPPTVGEFNLLNYAQYVGRDEIRRSRKSAKLLDEIDSRVFTKFTKLLMEHDCKMKFSKIYVCFDFGSDVKKENKTVNSEYQDFDEIIQRVERVTIEVTDSDRLTVRTMVCTVGLLNNRGSFIVYRSPLSICISMYILFVLT